MSELSDHLGGTDLFWQDEVSPAEFDVKPEQDRWFESFIPGDELTVTGRLSDFAVSATAMHGLWTSLQANRLNSADYDIVYVMADRGIEPAKRLIGM